MGMSFLWESHGKCPMGWDRLKLLWDGNGTDKYVPWTTLGISRTQVGVALQNIRNKCKCGMAFLKVLEATKRRRTGTFGFWGQNLRFARIFTPLKCNMVSKKVLQSSDSA